MKIGSSSRAMKLSTPYEPEGAWEWVTSIFDVTPFRRKSYAIFLISSGDMKSPCESGKPGA